MNAMPTVLPLWADLLAGALLVVGAAFALVSAIGLVKLDDFYKRLHAPSKATTLGVGCALLASALVFALGGRGSLHELLITLFLFVTAPVSAHLLISAVLQARPQDAPPAPPSATPPAPPSPPPQRPAPPP